MNHKINACSHSKCKIIKLTLSVTTGPYLIFVKDLSLFWRDFVYMTELTEYICQSRFKENHRTTI